eukprot:UN01879
MWIEYYLLWVEIAAMQIFGCIFPMFTLWPSSLIQTIVYQHSWFHTALYPDILDHFYEHLKEYITNNDIPNSDEYLYLVGHSLGGSISEVVAAQIYETGTRNVFSIGLSSPGTFYSSKKFDFTGSNLDYSSIYR